MKKAYLLLGSNEGDRLKNIKRAIDLLQKHGQIVTTSKVYETEPWGLSDQPHYLNAAIEIRTALSAVKLLSATEQIESSLGRERAVKWGQRTLDIDILLYGDDIINSENLTVPHPFLQIRRFALVPLAEITPNLTHPALKKDIKTLLDECPDTLSVSEYA